MKLSERQIAFFASAPLLVLSCAGCMKPNAQSEVDHLALQVRDEPGCTQALRQWFTAVQSTRQSQQASSLRIPASLHSEWWKTAQAQGAWSNDGALQKITVARQPWESLVVIGAPDATPAALGLTRQVGEPPAFYAQVTDGVYTCMAYYK